MHSFIFFLGLLLLYVKGTCVRGTWEHMCRTEARSRFQSHRKLKGSTVLQRLTELEGLLAVSMSRLGTAPGLQP